MEVSLSVLGAGGIGKSALTIQYVFNRYEPDYDPTIEDMYKRQQEIDGVTSMLSVLDTAGQEEFFAMRDSWIRNGDCFVCVACVALELRGAQANLRIHLPREGPRRGDGRGAHRPRRQQVRPGSGTR